MALIEATDLAGVRVITFLQSEALDFADEALRHFVIDRQNSEDKSSALAVQAFGYLSIHLIIQLREAPRPEEFVHHEIHPEQLRRLPTLSDKVGNCESRLCSKVASSMDSGCNCSST